MLFLGVVVTCVVCACVCLVQANSVRELKCSIPKVTTVKMSVHSRRNQSGHWISQFELKHGEEATNTPRSILMDVEHTTSVCANQETVGIKATVTATPYKAALLGYELFPGVGYYKFHANVSIWQTAHDVCAEEGAHLAMTNSERETNVFQTIFARYPKITGADDDHNNHAWLGFCEIGTHGKYFSLSGDSINEAEFFRWSPSEPNNSGGFDCLLVNRNTGGFADAPRTWVAPFICEQEL